MCYTKTFFYHNCKHYGRNPVLTHRCVRGERVAAANRGCDYTESLGVLAKYEDCPDCINKSRQAQATQARRTSTSNRVPSRSGGRLPHMDCDRFNMLVREHAATFDSSGRRK